MLKDYQATLLHDLETQLKFLSGANITSKEYQILKNTGFLLFLSNKIGESPMINWSFEIDWVDAMLEWTGYYLNQCRGYSRGISTVQQAFLARGYAPGGPLVQPAAERFAGGRAAYEQL